MSNSNFYSLQYLPPDDCLRFVMKQGVEYWAALLVTVAPHSVNRIMQRHLTFENRAKVQSVLRSQL